MGAELGEFIATAFTLMFLFLLCLLFLLLVREAMPFPFSAVRGCVSFAAGAGTLRFAVGACKAPTTKKRTLFPPLKLQKPSATPL